MMVGPTVLIAVERLPKRFPDFERLDDTFPDTPENKRRADYLFRQRGVIIEQKELQSDRLKQLEAAERQHWEVMSKYGLSSAQFNELQTRFGLNDPRMRAAIMPILERMSDDDKKRATTPLLNAVRFIEDGISNADKQIAGTKQLVGRDDLGGLVLFLTEVGRYLPQNVNLAIQSLLNPANCRFAHVDGVVLFQKFKGVRIKGRSGMTLFISNGQRSKAVDEYAIELTNMSLSPGESIFRDIPWPDKAI
jgi:hypothetical protein